MANRNEYRERSNANYEAHHDASGQRANRYSENQTPEEAYQSKHSARFTKQLTSVAGQEAYDKQRNLLDFRNDDNGSGQNQMKDVLADYVTAFNNGKYGGASDRREAAMAVAENTFRPLYKEVEKLEAREETLVDPAVLEALNKERVKYAIVQNADGSSELKILLRNRKQAEKLEKLTGLEMNVVEMNKANRSDFREMRKEITEGHKRRREEEREPAGYNAVGTVRLGDDDDPVWGPSETLKMLDFHKGQFANAMYESDRERALTVEYLAQTLEDAGRTSANWERKNLNYDSVKNLEHDEALQITEIMQERQWAETYERISKIAQKDDGEQEARVLEYCMQNMMTVYGESARHALSAQNAHQYDLCVSHCRETSAKFAKTIDDGGGMVKDETYTPVHIPENGFDNAREAEDFLKKTQSSLDGMNFGKLHHMYQSTVSKMLEEMSDHITDAKAASGRRSKDDEDQGILDQQMAAINGIGQAVNRIMSPAAVAR